MIEGFTARTEILEVGRSMAEMLEEIRQSRIDPETFKGISGFDSVKIEKDVSIIKRLEERYRPKAGTHDERDEKRYGEGKIVETIMPMIIRDFDWLGPDAQVIFTSLYDDLINGIDSVVQFPGEKMNNLGMEIDFASSEKEMMDKVKKIAESLQKGIISSVEYFDSPLTGKMKGVKMPKIAFGATGKEMGNLAEVVADAYLTPGKKEAAGKELRNHPMKKRFITLASNQLREFGKIAELAHHDEIAKLHYRVLDILKQRNIA